MSTTAVVTPAAFVVVYVYMVGVCGPPVGAGCCTGPGSTGAGDEDVVVAVETDVRVWLKRGSVHDI